jgi:hypothetical protein
MSHPTGRSMRRRRTVIRECEAPAEPRKHTHLLPDVPLTAQLPLRYLRYLLFNSLVLTLLM